MVVKRGIVTALIAGLIILLCGCGDAMPDMTEEQNDLIAEYCAMILLKHSNNYNYRIASVEAVERSIFEDNQNLIEAVEEAEKNKETDQTETEGEENATENSDTVTVEATAKDELYAKDANFAELLGISDSYEMTYTSYEIGESYSNENNESGFQISALKENELLVVHFTLKNITEEKIHCDMMDINPTIKIKINDQKSLGLQNTLLMNDLTTYISDLEPNESVDLVGIVEYPAEEIQSINFIVNNKGEKMTLVIE